MSEDKDNVWELVDALVGLLLFVPTIILRGWVLSILWGWFITPALSVPVPSIPICLGLSLIGPMLVGTVSLNRSKEKLLVDTILTSVVVSLLSLGFGWIIHLFV